MNALETIIRDEISAHGTIPFSRFMELALYHPAHGYYEREDRPIGRRGDFFTSVSVGSLFGELLAFQFTEWAAELDGGVFQIAEAGAHDGRLAVDILAGLRSHRPDLFSRLEYWIIEPSPRREAWQRTALAEFAGKVRWLRGPVELAPAAGSAGLRGVIFANELLDAMPVRRLGWDAREHRWFEWGVAVEQGVFGWKRMPLRRGLCLPLAPALPTSQAGLNCCSARRRGSATLPCGTLLEELPAALLDVLPDGFTVEICPLAIEWWQAAARALGRGWLVAFDYGLTAEECFRPERREGTLRAYRQHQVSGNVLEQVGDQDLTAHVNFTALQSSGEAAGLTLEVFSSQGQFLAHVLKQMHERKANADFWTAKRTRQLHTLVHPDHLGRAFRVLVQSRS